MSSKYYLNITGFKQDRIKISLAEFELAKEGKPILWLDGSFHVWPSMNNNKDHICSFEVERFDEFYNKRNFLSNTFSDRGVET